MPPKRSISAALPPSKRIKTDSSGYTTTTTTTTTTIYPATEDGCTIRRPTTLENEVFISCCESLVDIEPIIHNLCPHGHAILIAPAEISVTLEELKIPIPTAMPTHIQAGKAPLVLLQTDHLDIAHDCKTPTEYKVLCCSDSKGLLCPVAGKDDGAVWNTGHVLLHRDVCGLDSWAGAKVCGGCVAVLKSDGARMERVDVECRMKDGMRRCSLRCDGVAECGSTMDGSDLSDCEDDWNDGLFARLTCRSVRSSDADSNLKNCGDGTGLMNFDWGGPDSGAKDSNLKGHEDDIGLTSLERGDYDSVVKDSDPKDRQDDWHDTGLTDLDWGYFDNAAKNSNPKGCEDDAKLANIHRSDRDNIVKSSDSDSDLSDCEDSWNDELFTRITSPSSAGPEFESASNVPSTENHICSFSTAIEHPGDHEIIGTLGGMLVDIAMGVGKYKYRGCDSDPTSQNDSYSTTRSHEVNRKDNGKAIANGNNNLTKKPHRSSAIHGTSVTNRVSSAKIDHPMEGVGNLDNPTPPVKPTTRVYLTRKRKRGAKSRAKTSLR